MLSAAFFLASSLLAVSAQKPIFTFADGSTTLKLDDNFDPQPFQVRLDSPPSKPVQVYLSAPSDLQLSTCVLTFDQSNFGFPQSVAVQPQPLYQNKAGIQNVTGVIQVGILRGSSAGEQEQMKIPYTRKIVNAQSCSYTGDPHLRTFDSNVANGPTIDNQRPGFFWLVNSDSLKVQVQHYPCNYNGALPPNPPRIFCVLGVAVQYLDELIMISPESFYGDASKAYFYMQPGFNYRYLSVVQATPRSSPGELRFDVRLNGLNLLTTQVVRPLRSYNRGYINLNVFLPSRFRTHISGLCGNYDYVFSASNEIPGSKNNRNLVNYTEFSVPTCQNLFALGEPLPTSEQSIPDPVIANKRCTFAVASKTVMRATTLTFNSKSLTFNGICCQNQKGTAACDSSTVASGSVFPMQCGDMNDWGSAEIKDPNSVNVENCPINPPPLIGFLDSFTGFYDYFEFNLRKREVETAPDPNAVKQSSNAVDPNVIINSKPFIAEFNVTVNDRKAIHRNCSEMIAEVTPCRAIVGEAFFNSVIAECLADTLTTADDDNGKLDFSEEQPEEKMKHLLTACNAYTQSLIQNPKAAVALPMDKNMVDGDKMMTNEQDQVLKKRSNNPLDYARKLARSMGFGDEACPQDCNGHGVCTSTGCTCNPGFGGLACGKPLKRRTLVVRPRRRVPVTKKSKKKGTN